jgi:hypothetical protein
MSTISTNPADKVVPIFNPACRKKLDIVRADKLTKRRIPWLWPDYIPLGGTTSLTGLPGNAKSMAVCSFAAALTRGGTFPDGSESPLPPSECLLLSLEDDAESVLLPRLEAAGADLTKVHIIKSALVGSESGKGDYGHIALDKDRDAIQQVFRENPNIRLFVIDPISDFLGTKSLISEQEIRSLLYGIETSGVSILQVAHLNKKLGLSAQQRTMGAGALIGKPRANFLFACEDKRKNEFHFLPTKCNYANPSGLRYSIETVDMLIEGVTVQVPFVAWHDKSDKDADSILEKQAEKKTALQTAIEFLQALLKSGPRSATECQKAADIKGISDASLRRAKGTLGVESKKEGVGLVKLILGRKVWMTWELDLGEPEDPQQRYFTQQQLGKIIDEAPGQYRTLFALLAGTGMRIGEAAGLHVDDLDLDNCVIQSIRGRSSSEVALKQRRKS